MSETMEFTGRLVVVWCWCGIAHAVPASLRRKQQREHADGRRQTDIYCPLGHTYVIAGEGEAARLRRHLAASRDREAGAAARLDQAEASARAYKGAATRARRRAGNGVCPCCNRTFSQLARHMAAKHPGFDPAAEGKAPPPAPQALDAAVAKMLRDSPRPLRRREIERRLGVEGGVAEALAALRAEGRVQTHGRAAGTTYSVRS